jgi:hypothetical protein
MTDMDADTKFDPLGLRRRRILLNHAALHLDGASGGIEDAGELDQHAIAARTIRLVGSSRDLLAVLR